MPLMLLEVLHLTLVLLSLFHRGEGAEIAALTGRRIFLARIEAVFSGFEFADHL